MKRVENTISYRLNYVLRVRKLSSTELARLTKIPNSSLSGYISGKFQPKAETLIRIANAVGTTVQWLAGETPIDTINVPGNTSINDPQEQLLLTAFRKMNFEGREFAVQVIQALAENTKYT